MLGKGRWVGCKCRHAFPFNIGETIKVVDGPFNGFNGTVEKLMKKKKIKLMVKFSEEKKHH
jgi:transcriptional antiterminator NusG